VEKKILNKILAPTKLIHIEIGLESNFINVGLQAFY